MCSPIQSPIRTHYVRACNNIQENFMESGRFRMEIFLRQPILTNINQQVSQCKPSSFTQVSKCHLLDPSAKVYQKSQKTRKPVKILALPFHSCEGNHFLSKVLLKIGRIIGSLEINVSYDNRYGLR